MRLIVITPEKSEPDETGIVNNLFINGLGRLHIRKPLFTTNDYHDYVNAIDERYHHLLVIHGCFELYDEYKLGGIHLNSAMRNNTSTRAGIGHVPHHKVSTSFHNWQEIADNEFGYGYVFISPVFDSISKAGYKAGIDMNGAMEIKQTRETQNKYCPEIIGLGGVGQYQIKTLYEHGFDGAAVLGAIWGSNDPVEEFKKVMEVVISLEHR